VAPGRAFRKIRRLQRTYRPRSATDQLGSRPSPRKGCIFQPRTWGCSGAGCREPKASPGAAVERRREGLTIPQQQPPPQPTPSPAAPADRAPLRKPARETQGEKWDVFVSHASEDKAYVDPLVTALEAAGISVWYDRLVLKWGDDLRPVIGRNSTVPSKPPHSAASPGPKPNAIAFAQYEGPAGRRVHLLVRKSATEENMFTLEDADGQEHEGARQDIALKYTLADKRLTMNGFKRMQNSGGSEYPEFNL
jgi:hypothetical protein